MKEWSSLTQIDYNVPSMHQAHMVLNMKVTVITPWAIDVSQESWIEIYLGTQDKATDSYSVSMREDSPNDAYGQACSETFLNFLNEFY